MHYFFSKSFLCAQNSIMGIVQFYHHPKINKSIFTNGEIPKTRSSSSYEDFKGNLKSLNLLNFRY